MKLSKVNTRNTRKHTQLQPKQSRLFGAKSTFSQLNAKVSRDDEDDEAVGGEAFCGYFMEHKSITRLVIPIDTAFKDPFHYRMVVNKIDELSEEDQIEIWLNSDGGDLSGLVALLTAIKTTSAQTLAVIQGSCHSAASILALSCDAIQVSPYATMLCHSIRFGTTGKGADVRAQVQHTNDFAESIFREAYELFLTEDEIEDVLKGRELWLNYDEISERLENKYAILNEEMQQLQDQIDSGCCGDPSNCDDVCACPCAVPCEDEVGEDDPNEYTED